MITYKSPLTGIDQVFGPVSHLVGGFVLNPFPQIFKLFTQKDLLVELELFRWGIFLDMPLDLEGLHVRHLTNRT